MGIDIKHKRFKLDSKYLQVSYYRAKPFLEGCQVFSRHSFVLFHGPISRIHSGVSIVVPVAELEKKSYNKKS